MAFRFSGHETFICRNLWLNKGYNFVKNGNQFSDPNAVVELGVGKNMVESIKYWLNAFGITTAKGEIGSVLFDPKNGDPYLEDEGTLWLLHYLLVKNNYASTFNIIFNHFRKGRIDFSKDQYVRHIEWRCSETGTPFNKSIVEKDFSIFARTYIRPNKIVGVVEDDLSGVLQDLELVREIDGIYEDATRFAVFASDREELPVSILLYCILDSTDGLSLSFYELLNGENSVGSIFALTPDGLRTKIDEIMKNWHGITYKDDAGIKELQFKQRPDKMTILRGYYGR